MEAFSKKSIFFLVLFSMCMPVLAQHEHRIRATTKTSISEEFDLKELKNSRRRTVNYLVVTDIRDVAYGNRCVTEATRRLGFIYTPMPIIEVERKSKFHYFIHNHINKFKVTLKHGPGWKKKLKKVSHTVIDING